MPGFQKCSLSSKFPRVCENWSGESHLLGNQDFYKLLLQSNCNQWNFWKPVFFAIAVSPKTNSCLFPLNYARSCPCPSLCSDTCMLWTRPLKGKHWLSGMQIWTVFFWNCFSCFGFCSSPITSVISHTFLTSRLTAYLTLYTTLVHQGKGTKYPR